MDASELARRVGVPVDFAEQLVELGILKPDDDGSFSRGDLFRVRLMRSSAQAGVPLEGIAQAINSRRFTLSFLDMPHYRLSTLHGKSFAEMAQESGIRWTTYRNVEESQGRGLKIFLLGIIELAIVIDVFGALLAIPVDTKGGNPCYPQEPDVIDGEIFCR